MSGVKVCILPATAAGASADSYREEMAPAAAREVVAFWEGAGPALWFAKDDAFDRRFRERFLPLHEAAARGDLDGWSATPAGALALMVLLDQFPRNAFRGTPRMYATDAAARKLAVATIAAGHDRFVAVDLQKFFYLPFGHSEDLADPAAGDLHDRRRRTAERPSVPDAVGPLHVVAGRALRVCRVGEKCVSAYVM